MSTTSSPTREEKEPPLLREEEVRSENKDSRTLHVSAVPRRCTSDALREIFTKHGEVEACHLVIDPHTKEHRGFGFVTMRNSQGAQSALDKLDRADFDGQTISVQVARRGQPHHATPGVYIGARGPRETKETREPRERRSGPGYGPDRERDSRDRGDRGDRDRDRERDRRDPRDHYREDRSPPPLPPPDRYGPSRYRDERFPPADRYADKHADRYHDRGGERYPDRYGDRYGDRYADRYPEKYAYDRFPPPGPDRFAPPPDRYYDDRRYEPYRR